MPLLSFEGRTPQVHPDAWVAPTATLIGDVVVEAGASVWYGVVLRGDFGRVWIRDGANVQDNSVLHGGSTPDIEIGPGATIGHLCVIHGATVGADAIVGNSTTVQDGAHIGAGTLIGAGSLVPPNAQIADGVLALGSPAKERGPIAGGVAELIATNPARYQNLARRHAQGAQDVS